MKIILASGSKYRQSILQKLHLPFTSQSPDIDESPLPEGENVEQQVFRLAAEKATAVAKTQSNKDSYIIGSDQLAVFNGHSLGKPGNFSNARQQLLVLSGQTVRFYTGLCLIDLAHNRMEQTVETFDVEFKSLSEKQICTYLTIEQPFDCAGSFKSEGLGIALFNWLTGRDPNTLIGLPLITLIELFEKMGVDVFEHMQK